MFSTELLFQASLLIGILRQLSTKMAAPMNNDNLYKIVQSYDKKLELKPKQRETLIYLGFWKGYLILSYGPVTEISRDDGLLSEPTTEVNGNDP